MPQSNQEQGTARRFHTDNYDTELPADVRSELEGAPPPKRPRILGQPRTGSATPRWPLYVLLLAATIAIAGLLAARYGEGASQNALRSTKQSVLPTPTPQPTVVPSPPVVPQSTVAPQPLQVPPPAPGWHSDGTAYGRAGVIGQRTAPAPRATLVRLPAPRAELVSIPVGGSLWITMPYNERVWITYTGHVPSFETLPPSGNFIGETRVAADTNIPWVWTAPPGGVAQWVDP